MQLGSLQYPHNPMKGASEHFHFLFPTTTQCATSTRGLPAPQLHRGPDRARAQDAPQRRQHPFGQLGLLSLDGTMTDVFIHLLPVSW